MPKVCDPPQFNGGQSVGVEYIISFKTQGDDCCNADRNLVVQHNLIRRGKINIGIFVGATANPPITTPTLGTFTRYSVFVTFQNSDGSFGSVIARSFNQFSVFGSSIRFFDVMITRVDGLPDTGGNRDPICRCEGDSTTITCANSEGGICCIENSSIRDLCSRLG